MSYYVNLIRHFILFSSHRYLVMTIIELLVLVGLLKSIGMRLRVCVGVYLNT